MGASNSPRLLLPQSLRKASKPRGSTASNTLTEELAAALAGQLWAPQWGEDGGAPSGGPPLPDDPTITNGSRSHQLPPVSVPAMTARTMPSEIASTITDGVLELPESRLLCISSTILCNRHNIWMPDGLRVSLPPPPTSVCSHPSQSMIIHLVGNSFLHRMQLCWRSPWQLKSLFMHRMNSITVSPDIIRWTLCWATSWRRGMFLGFCSHEVGSRLPPVYLSSDAESTLGIKY